MGDTKRDRVAAGCPSREGAGWAAEGAPPREAEATQARSMQRQRWNRRVECAARQRGWEQGAHEPGLQLEREGAPRGVLSFLDISMQLLQIVCSTICPALCAA